MRLLAVLLLTGACGTRGDTVAVCGRGDRAALAASLAGGTLSLRFRNQAGEVLAELDAAIDRPSRIDAATPDGAVSIEVIGTTAAGTAIAHGASGVEAGGSCVCLALDPQYRAACQDVACRVVDDRCEFSNRSGGPVGSRTLVVGDNPTDDLPGATADTWLSSTAGAHDTAFGDDPTLVVAAEPPTTGLARFALAGFPRASSIEHAELELRPCPGCAADGTLAVYDVLEPWDEGAGASACASWDCRSAGVPWSVPGCGHRSELERSRSAAALAIAAIGDDGELAAFDVTAAVARWVADPTTNHGVAITVDELGAVSLAAREAAVGEGARPRLRVTFAIPDDGGAVDAGPDAPPEQADGGPDGAMAAIPGTTFTMGCDPATATCPADETPPHAVTLSAYRIDRTEVTRGAYAACVTAAACAVPACDWDPVDRPTHPVGCVTYAQASDYCAFVDKRLPTEAEWELAARGTDGRSFPWGDEPSTCALANRFGCSGGPEPVGGHPSGDSPYGVSDMAGNVVEWVADYYAAGYYDVSPPTDPRGPATGTNRVRRGGGYAADEDGIRVTGRRPSPPSEDGAGSGFRCAADGP